MLYDIESGKVLFIPISYCLLNQSLSAQLETFSEKPLYYGVGSISMYVA